MFGYFYLFTWPRPFPPGITQRVALALAFSMPAVVSIKLYKAQFNAPIRKIILVAVAAVLVALAVAAPQQLAIAEAHAGEPGLEGYCYGVDGCNEYCQNRHGICSELCKRQPENPICGQLETLRTGG